MNVRTFCFSILALALASGAAVAEAQLTPDQQCLIGRTTAWNKYLGCQAKVLANLRQPHGSVLGKKDRRRFNP